MSARSKARKRAVDVLYSADIMGTPLGDAIAAAEAIAAGEPDRRASWEYAREILTGYAANADVIDEMISSYARNWTLQRMPAVDRAVLRAGTWEILYSPEVPREVAIAEAVELASNLSTDESAPFVNGVLAAIAVSA